MGWLLGLITYIGWGTGDIKTSMDRGISFIHKIKELEDAVSTGKELLPIDINEVITEVKKEYGDMVIDVSGEGVVLADQALFSVLDNLIKNAKIHGGVSKIGVVIEEKGKYVVVKIIDQGKGIPEEVKEKLFEEGFKYGETGNTGIGLYIVKKTVERYGGSVEVEANMPSGTIFILNLIKAESKV